MILLSSFALAGQGISWVVKPHYEPGLIVGLLALEPGVEADDLTARVDGELVDIETVAGQDLGVHSLLSFDASGSFRPFSARAFVLAEQLIGEGSRDRTAVMVFGLKSRQWAATDDPEQARSYLAEAAQMAASEKETRLAAFLLQAIDQAADAPPAHDGGVRRVIVFTDAGEESEVFSSDEVIERAVHRGVIVDAVVFARVGNKSFAEDLDRISRITRNTGGHLVEIHDSSAVDLAPLSGRHVRVEVPHCGEQSGSIEIAGPKGFHTDPANATGSPEPCATPPASEATPSAKPVVLPDRLSGLVCLLLLLGTLAGIAFGIWTWVTGRDEQLKAVAPPKASPSAPPPPPSVDPSRPVDNTLKRPYSPAFDLKLPETHLEVVAGDLPVGTRWRFSGRMLRLGAVSEDNDVVVELPQISGQHARFEVFPDRSVFVEDLGSANGTWIDGERLVPHTRTPVQMGQQIALSSQVVVTLRFGSDS